MRLQAKFVQRSSIFATRTRTLTFYNLGQAWDWLEHGDRTHKVFRLFFLGGFLLPLQLLLLLECWTHWVIFVVAGYRVGSLESTFQRTLWTGWHLHAQVIARCTIGNSWICQVAETDICRLRLGKVMIRHEWEGVPLVGGLDGGFDRGCFSEASDSW